MKCFSYPRCKGDLVPNGPVEQASRGATVSCVFDERAPMAVPDTNLDGTLKTFNVQAHVCDTCGRHCPVQVA